MQADRLALAAKAFLDRLPELDAGLGVTDVEMQLDAGPFREIFRDTVAPRGGTYWFFMPDGKVIDIGKSDHDIWERICSHAGLPVWNGTQSAHNARGIGEGWGFPKSSFLNRIDTTPAITDCVREGLFHVGWAAFSPGFCATLLEVYLQCLCEAVDGQRPVFCIRTG